MKKRVRILIVEDEFITLDLLRTYVEDIGYEVSGDAMRAAEAIEILEQRDTDIVLLDINIKGNQNGIWIAEQICKKYHIPFIFITAYNDPHTIQNATKTHPSGYLIKPFSKDDIFAAIEVALQNYAHTYSPSVTAPQIGEVATALRIDPAIFIKDGLTFKKINIGDICYVESCKNYLELHLSNQKLVVRATLQKFYDMLPKNDFVQIHRSFIVNIRFIDTIRLDRIYIGTSNLPLSKNYKDDFYAKLQFLA